MPCTNELYIHCTGYIYIYIYTVLDGEAVLEGIYSFHINCLQSFVTKADQNVAQLNLLLEYVAADSEAVRMGLTCHL